jgi:hypothetical protein
MQLDDALEIPSHVVSREVSGEMVLLDLETGSYFGLDAVGARIWELAGQGMTLAAICDEILKDYDVTRERVEQDVLELFGDLVKEKLVAVRS